MIVKKDLNKLYKNILVDQKFEFLNVEATKFKQRLNKSTICLR